MRKLRNPRYAPEFLERKLSPSSMSMGITPPPVYMAPPPAATANDPMYATNNSPAIDDPLPLPPPPPTDPEVPAIAA